MQTYVFQQGLLTLTKSNRLLLNLSTHLKKQLPKSNVSIISRTIPESFGTSNQRIMSCSSWDTWMSKEYPETGVNVTMTGRSTKGETCTLTIKGLNPNSSAVYFCVASHTVLYSIVSQYKNLLSATFFPLFHFSFVAHSFLHLDHTSSQHWSCSPSRSDIIIWGSSVQ